MTYTDIKRHLQDGTTPNFIIFTGEEREVQLAYIRKIAESKQQVIKRIDGVGEAFKTQGLSLLGQSVCYVCSEDSEFQKAESVWDTINESVGNNTLIYQVPKIDKRSKFYTYFESQILVFDHMTEQVLIKHIKYILPLSTENCKELIAICENDYSRILLEIDKIIEYWEAVNDGVVTINEDAIFRKFVDEGTIYRPPTDAIFEWVDALLRGQPKRAFRLYEECKELGEPSLRLLLVLYQGIKRLLQVQSCKASNISENTGLSQWEINLVKDKVNIYGTLELVNALKVIRALEKGIKTGQVEEEFTVPYAMVSLLRE